MAPPEKIQPEKLTLFFREVCAGDELIFNELVDDSLHAIKEVREALVPNLPVKAIPGVARQVHSLKSILRTLGGEAAAHEALRMERALRGNPERLPVDYPTLLDDFLGSLSEFEESLHDLREQIGGRQTASI